MPIIRVDERYSDLQTQRLENPEGWEEFLQLQNNALARSILAEAKDENIRTAVGQTEASLGQILGSFLRYHSKDAEFLELEANSNTARRDYGLSSTQSIEAEKRLSAYVVQYAENIDTFEDLPGRPKNRVKPVLENRDENIKLISSISDSKQPIFATAHTIEIEPDEDGLTETITLSIIVFAGLRLASGASGQQIHYSRPPDGAFGHIFGGTMYHIDNNTKPNTYSAESLHPETSARAASKDEVAKLVRLAELSSLLIPNIDRFTKGRFR